MRLKTPGFKITAFATSLALFFTSLPLSSSASSAEPSQALVRVPDSIALPEELGLVTEEALGEYSGRVILIEDAHSVPEAQKQIQKILQHLQSKYSVKKIGLEGTSTRLDPFFFKSFPDADRLKTVFQDYLKR